MKASEFKAWRERMGWTQFEASVELGLTPEHISRLENGKRIIKKTTELSCKYLEAVEQGKI